MSYHFRHVSKSDEFHTHSDDRASGGPKPMPFVSVDGRKALHFTFLISTELIPPDTDHRHYLDTSPVLRSERTATEAGEKFRFGSTRAEITTPRDVIGSSPATLLCIGRSSIKFRVPLTDRELPRMKLCGAVHSQINYWQKQNGEWKRDPKPSQPF